MMAAVILLALANVLTVLYCYGRTKMLEDAVNKVIQALDAQRELNKTQSEYNDLILGLLKGIGE